MTEFTVPDKMTAEDDYKVALYQAAQVAASYIKDVLTTNEQGNQDKKDMALKLLAIVEGTPLNLYRGFLHKPSKRGIKSLIAEKR